MIKRYILHIETHWRHLPRISFKRAPRPGDRVKDGGVWGTLRRCPTCQEGFLHEPDPRRKKRSNPLPPGPHTWIGSTCLECEASTSWCPYPPAKPKTPLLGLIAVELAKNIQTGRSSRVRPARSYHTPRPAMDFNGPQHVKLKIEEETPVEHVELKVTEPEPDISDKDPILQIMVPDEEESPETLELDYTLGTRDYKSGETVWTRKAEYVVDKLEDNVLYLVRKDVWKARKKKAKHVELKLDEPAEHVELKVKGEEPSEIVQLKFDSN